LYILKLKLDILSLHLAQMAADMDIEMDLDIGLEDMAIPDTDLVLDYKVSSVSFQLLIQVQELF
jgi:hypothetical protein